MSCHVYQTNQCETSKHPRGKINLNNQLFIGLDSVGCSGYGAVLFI